MSGMSHRTYTIVLSSAGRRVSLMRSLREDIAAVGMNGRVIACDLSSTAPAMHLADASFYVPRVTDPDFLPRMREICTQEKVDLVVPTIDTELSIWARAREEFAAAGTVVAVSSPETIEIAADKRATHAHCRDNGLPCPRQASVTEVLAHPDGWPLPLIVKPARGSSSVGLQHITSYPELEAFTASHEYVVEEHAPGVEYTVDVFVDRSGVAHHPVVRRRWEVRSGEVSKAQVVRDGLLESLAVKTVETLPGAYGVLNVQIFSDGSTASIIEINARFGGGYPLTWHAGGRFGEWLIRELIHNESPPTQAPIENGLMMLRWDEEVFVHAR